MDNPYSSSLSEGTSVAHSSSLTPGVMQALGGTKPWVRLCSVIGFVCSGFMVLGALAMLLAGGAMFAAGGTGPSGGGPSPSALAGGMPVVLSLIYLVMAAFYIMPSIKLWKYGTHILSLMNSQSMDDLEKALDAQRGFWKFVGIMILVLIVIYALLIIGMLVVGIFAGVSSTSTFP